MVSVGGPTGATVSKIATFLSISEGAVTQLLQEGRLDGALLGIPRRKGVAATPSVKISVQILVRLWSAGKISVSRVWTPPSRSNRTAPPLSCSPTLWSQPRRYPAWETEQAAFYSLPTTRSCDGRAPLTTASKSSQWVTASCSSSEERGKEWRAQ